MKPSNLKKMITVSKLYYEDNMTQDAIAKKLKISVPQISRIITAAKNQGYVKTSVVDPFSESDDLSKRLISEFNLKDVRIIKNSANDIRVTQTNASQAGADYLLDIARANDIISIAYSNIIYKIPQFLPKIHIENLSFVQPNGALFEQVKGYQFDTLREIGIKMDAYYYYFPAPAIVKDKQVKEALHDDPIIKWVMEKAEKSNVAFFSVGLPNSNSVFVKNGYIDKDEIAKFKNEGAVGEIFGHFINAKGKIHNKDFDKRVLGLSISTLREKAYSVCISAGEGLVDAIYATLIGKYCNVLITDTITAKQILEMKSNKK